MPRPLPGTEEQFWVGVRVETLHKDSKESVAHRRARYERAVEDTRPHGVIYTIEWVD